MTMMILLLNSVVVFLYFGITFLPRVRNDFWTFRILEYPRLQKLAIGILLLALVFVTRDELNGVFWWLTGILLVCCAYLVFKIFPYTMIAPKEMKRIRGEATEKSIAIFTANVLQDNRNYDSMLQQIRDMDPDIVFLVETDSNWQEGVKELEQRYPYKLESPLDNTYGLLFYSRLKLKNERVVFRVENDVPSVEACVQLKSGEWVRVFGLHPKPPVPKESMYSTAKDKELMKVAFEVEKEEMPCIVMGDLNDVAWSHVTELFRKVSGLLDPRRGRGFYSTFSANNKLMRFPLDYIFCSSDFGLVNMKRMPHNGSDHFAMFIHLQYEPQLKRVHDEPEADAGEHTEAKEKASETVSGL